WRCSPVLVHHLLRLPGLPVPDLSWLPTESVSVPPPWHASEPEVPALLAAGPAGSGRRTAAAEWAARLGLRALLFESTATAIPAAEALREAGLTAQLNQAALVLDLTAAEHATALEGLDAHCPLALLVREAEGWGPVLAPRLVQQQRLRLPDSQGRTGLWRSALAACGRRAPPKAIEAVAGRFALGEPAIRRAVRRLVLEETAP